LVVAKEKIISNVKVITTGNKLIYITYEHGKITSTKGKYVNITCAKAKSRKKLHLRNGNKKA
jgi:hypothetical protein